MIRQYNPDDLDRHLARGAALRSQAFATAFRSLKRSLRNVSRSIVLMLG